MPWPRQRHLALSLVGLAAPDGVSPLGWLLTEYLESVELPRRATGHRAAFASCVRRLTQLLVHVDPGGPEPEETRAAGEPGAAPECQAAALGLLWGASYGTEAPEPGHAQVMLMLVVMPQQWPCLSSVPSALLWQVSVRGLLMEPH